MKLKNIFKTSAIVGSVIVSCKQKDRPLTPEMYDMLDSLHRVERQSVLSYNLQKNQKDIIKNLGNTNDNISHIIMKKDNDSLSGLHNITSHILQGDNTVTNAQDSLITVKESKNQDSISKQIIHNESHTKIPINENNISINNQSTKEEIINTINNNNLQSEFQQLIGLFVKEPKNTKFDRKFVISKIYDIYKDRFILKGNTIYFIYPNNTEQQAINNMREELRQHIKDNNSMKGLFLGKDMLKKEFQKEFNNNSGEFYEKLVIKNNYIYNRGGSQFQKDLFSILYLYK